MLWPTELPARTSQYTGRAAPDSQYSSPMPPGDTNPRPRAPVFWIGALCLLIALSCSSMLAAKRFGATLPGCGVRSACDALERTQWGSIPGLNWPVSFLGVSYFG